MRGNEKEHTQVVHVKHQKRRRGWARFHNDKLGQGVVLFIELTLKHSFRYEIIFKAQLHMKLYVEVDKTEVS